MTDQPVTMMVGISLHGTVDLKEVTINLQKMNGKMVAKIPVKDTTADMMLSFCMRRSTADKEWADKDGGDHYVSVPANQNVVKSKIRTG